MEHKVQHFNAVYVGNWVLALQSSYSPSGEIKQHCRKTLFIVHDIKDA